MAATEWNKPSLLETSGSYWKTCTLHTGVKLDLFTIIGNTTLSAEEICEAVHGDTRGVATLLDALAAMDLLVKEKGLYRNTAFSLKFLVSSSPDYTGFIIMHHHHLMDSWNRMSESVLSGKPCRQRVSHGAAHERESFLMGMFNIAMGLAPSFAKEIDLSGKKRLLDLGGGPGTYAIHFSMNNPDLRSTIFDLPTTRAFAEKTIERFGMGERVDFMDGSYLDEQTRIERVFDAAWLSHILHGEGPEDAEKIIGLAVSALKPGGSIYIHEFILNDEKSAPLFPALFSINMLVGTDKGTAYSERELKAMLQRHGVKEIHRIDPKAAVTSGIVCGKV